MREYGKVYPRFWTGGTGKALRGDMEAQVLALYLMTCPHANMIGVFHCPIIYMAHETGLTIEGASKALQRLIEAGFCTFDGVDDVVWVHEMAAHQVGVLISPKDKQVLGLRKQVAQIAQLHIRQAFAARYAQDFHLLFEGENTSPLQAPCKPLPSQEQEQEQDKKHTPAKAVGFCFKTELLKLGAKPELVSDWLAVRSAKKARNTKTALDGFVREVGKSGWAISDVLRMCCERNWQGFNADWVRDSKPIEVDAKPRLDTSLEARRAAMQAQADESYKSRAWLNGEKRYRTVFKIEDGQIKPSRVYDSGVAA